MGGSDDTGARSFWGWGAENAALPADYVKTFKNTVFELFGIEEREESPTPEVGVHTLRRPRFALSQSLARFCTDRPHDRAGHTYGKAFRDVIRAIHGQFANPPDYVAYPESEDDLRSLMAFCADHAVALVPYGGGSSVVGGVEQPESAAYAGSISCDMLHCDNILSVDPVSRTARIQAGIYGPALEAGLKKYGLTLRHFPQSFEFSTLGGWIATRAGGHFATLYTHIDEFVQALRVLTPAGVFETREVPGTGDGPDANRMMIGSEGIFGIITEATMRLQTVPSYRASAPVRFPDEEKGFEAVRRISQSGLYPANCRLISSMESYAMQIGDGTRPVLLLGFESHDHPQEEKLSRALAICRGLRGTWDEEAVRTSERAGHGTPEAGETWKKNFLRAPYMRDVLARCAVITETFETAVTWNRLERFHAKVLAETQAALTEICGQGLVMWRLTHVYPDGATIYYTVIAPGRRGAEIRQWDAVKRAASDAVIAGGGTITHHHAVGRVHRPWYEKSRPAPMGKILGGVKQVLDPKWIMNPEVLIEPEG
jgi:alkyldihydroxyacetonephosphate synthase